MALPLACHLLILGHRDVSIAEQDGFVIMALRCSYCRPNALPSGREERGAAIMSLWEPVGSGSVGTTRCTKYSVPVSGNSSVRFVSFPVSKYLHILFYGNSRNIASRYFMTFTKL